VGRVLVVDDDITVREVVVSYLRAHGHRVEESGDGADALGLLSDTTAGAGFDLVVLDRMLPGLDGEEVCRRVRLLGDRRAEVPVIMLTALGEEGQRVAGLEAGADDYVTKPFSPRELALRVDSVLRRTGTTREPASVLADGDLVVDTRRHEASRAGTVLALTAREFDLLAFLLAHPDVAWSREELMERVWGWSVGDLSTVTVHVRRLREKVEADPRRPTRLVTVFGVGYRWEPAPGAEPA
jgi:DNA-binding response OmpR family regulator